MITLTATITKNDGSLINLNYRNSLSLERTIYDRSDLKLPSWGIISNGGNLRFVDSDGSIKRLAEQRLLKSGMKVNFYLKNTISNSETGVGEFFTDQWNYDNDNRRVDVTIKDDLGKWQDIKISPITYSPYNEKNITGEIIYDSLYSLTPHNFNMLNFEQLDTITKDHLRNCKIEFFVLNSNNLWSAWTTFCKAFQTHIYKNNSSNTICKYNGGN